VVPHATGTSDVALPQEGKIGMTNERSKLTARVGAVVPLTLYILFGMSRGLVAQTLQIVSPADGTLVASGQTVSVTVAGDPSVLQSVEMASAAQMGNAPTLTTPPYTFSVAINPEAPSGLSNLTAMGNLLSGGTPQVSQINIDVERADRPDEFRQPRDADRRSRRLDVRISCRHSFRSRATRIPPHHHPTVSGGRS